jgi:glycosyltransferase involved in cell wall biosynthesis
LIRNEANLGFPAAVNQGIKEATGDIIILLNNDVIVTPKWATKLTSWLNEFDIVGPMTNYSAGMQMVQIETYENTAELNKAADSFEEENRGCPAIDVNFIIGFCMVFKKNLWEQIGPFDESLWPCSGEEVDFCLRAKQAGFGIAVDPATFVHHEGSKTFEIMDVDYDAICKANDRHLAERWGNDCFRQVDTVESPQPSGLSLNLGCGYRHLDGFVNIDNRAGVSPDLVCNVIDGLPYADSSVDVVRAYDFLEHIPQGKVIDVITEIWRVLKPGGTFESFTPSTDGRGAFMDPTHVSYWNINSWIYYSDDQYRGLYDIKANFELVGIKDVGHDSENGVIHTHVVARAIK